MNRPQGWDARAALETQDTKLEGEVGVVIVTLAMPEKFDTVFYENFIDKLFSSVIPWPINAFAGVDAGTALLDPTQPTASTQIKPNQLADIWGRTTDIDGIPWVEKYRKGEVRWVPPSSTIPHDIGLFIYPKRKGGTRTATAKTMLKARHIYYDRLPSGFLPHESQTYGAIDSGLNQLRAKGLIKAGAAADGFNPWHMENAINEVLDSGIDTLVLSSSQPVYSDFEELRGTFRKAHKFIKAWETRNGGKKIKIVIAPHTGSQPAFQKLWTDHLTRTVPAPSQPGERAHVIISLHGLPPSLVNSDSWSQRHPAVTKALEEKFKAAMTAKGYSDVTIVPAFEGFADTIEDPKNVLVSVREEIDRAAAGKVGTVAIVPIEFLAENTDTLFSHAGLMFEGFPGYSVYEGPPANVDWAEAYVREFRKDGTRVFYTGTPGGNYTHEIGAIYAEAVAALKR